MNHTVTNTPAPYCMLHMTDPRRAYVPSHLQTPDKLAETFRRFTPVLVCPVKTKEKQGG